MVFGVYVVRDLKSTFMTPTVDQNDSTAARNFAHAVMKSDSVISSHKSDFELYKIATFDNETGSIVPLEVKELVVEGVNF
ncbi:nonstructural protein [Alces alces faeces associated microvirus MP18 4940]|uniref:nonstructural protein n=1 Tax=Alces alces faeces associated microvirus MP18 4940 TaxID=2219137 RepID=UPI000DF0839A|nr:nonstructural protein [Alces alces faeces associated microvirus MP18 4940]AXB22585.1 nonstructural protein [Alces alces faeces associated microvirus MP18 4940]